MTPIYIAIALLGLAVGYFFSFWHLVAYIVSKPRVADWLIARARRRPYSPIVKDGLLYMDRFWLFNPYPDTGGSGADRPRWQFPISIRIHHIVQPDQDRHLHSHPWNARTMILRGSYIEERKLKALSDLGVGWQVMQDGELLGGYMREEGDTAKLNSKDFHRITEVSEGGVWTMFITGKYRTGWGFDVDGVKIPWRKYLGLDK